MHAAEGSYFRRSPVKVWMAPSPQFGPFSIPCCSFENKNDDELRRFFIISPTTAVGPSISISILASSMGGLA